VKPTAMLDDGSVHIDPAGLPAQDVYKLLVGSVVPRPIAWVTTLGPSGPNAAPFSCYTFISTVPPMVAISCGRKDGTPKDTVSNALRAGEFVLNVVGEAFMKLMHGTSAEYPADVSEIEALAIPVEPSHLVKVPRIVGVPVSMECRVADVIEFGRLRTQLLIGEVVRFHVRQDCYRSGRVDFEAMRPVARLGGPYYASLGEVHHLAPVASYFHPSSEEKPTPSDA
jgi:flavin reductase (DIM6/NTAB) family NADH-FMN oxidoreductase RutF